MMSIDRDSVVGRWLNLHILITLLVAALPWCLGGVGALPYAVLGGISGLALALALAVAMFRERSLPRVPALTWWLLAAIAYGWFQQLPLPQRIVPSSSAFAAEFRGKAPSKLPISQAPDRTRADLSRLWVLALLVSFASLYRLNLTTLNILLLNSVCLALFGIVQRLTWNGCIYWRIKSPSSFSFASFVNHNNAGGYLCMALAIAAALWFNFHLRNATRHNWPKQAALIGGLYRFAFGTIVFAILLTLSRGAFLGMLAALLMLGLFLAVKRGTRVRVLPIVGIACAIVFIVFWSRSFETISNRVLSIVDSNEFESVRFQHWRDDATMVTENWGAGCGVGAYRFANRKYKSFISKGLHQPNWWIYSENQYLETVIVAGIPGLLVLCGLLYTVGRSIHRRSSSRTIDNATLAFLGIGVLASQVVAAAFDFGLYLSANASLFVVICAAVSSVPNELSPILLRHRCLQFVGWASIFLCAIWAAPDLVGRVLVERELAINDRPLSRSAAERRPLKVIHENIDGLRNALKWLPNDAMANLRLGELYLEKAQTEVFNELSASTTGLSLDRLWEASSVFNFHRRAHQPGANDGVKENPLLKQNVLAATDALLASRNSCPLIAKTHHRLALVACLLPTNEIDEAKSIRRAAHLSPTNPTMHLACSALAFAGHNRELALELLRQSIQYSQHFEKDHAWLVASFLNQKEFLQVWESQSVESVIDACLSDAILSVPVNFRRALVVQAVDRIENEDAESAFVRYQLHHSVGTRDLALKNLKQAVLRRPSYDDWRYRLAYRHFVRSDYKSARYHTELCLAQRPNSKRYKKLLQQINRRSQVSVLDR